MNIRAISSLCVVFFLLLLIPTFGADTNPDKWSRPVEIRGVWVDKGSIPKTEQGIRDLIRSYAKAGINLVHPEVIFNGYAAYPSSYLPQKDLWPGVDMLGVLIDEAHKHKIEVHPWVWVFRAGNVNDKGGILTQHPDWAMIDKAGNELTENESYWLNPCNPAVRHTLMRAYQELAEKYPIDGIQLDYIRFPSPDHGYNEDCRAKFQAEYGIDPINIEPFTKPVIDWYLWRERLINTFVERVSWELRLIRPELQISAAVASYPDQARINYLQDWEYWADNTWVDFLAPMDYTADTIDFMNRVEASADRIRFEALLAPGIGLHLQQDAKPMLDQIHIARCLPVEGATLFATAYLDKDRLKALREGPFRKKAGLPFREPLEKAKVLLSDVQGKLKEGMDFGPLVEAQSETESAKKLMDWTSYRKLGLGRSVQFPPPIFIPEEVVPIPDVQVPRISSAPVIDGKLDDAVWNQASRISLTYNNLGYFPPQTTGVYLAYDAQNLYIAYQSYEPDIDKLKAAVTEHDSSVFDEDSAEFFLSMNPDGSNYYQFAFNTLGTEYEAQVYNTGFNPEWQVAVTKEEEYWKAEVAIPFSSLNVSTPKAGTTWRANFCRNRVLQMTADQVQNMCWSPTYGSYHTPVRFGKIVFGQEVK